MKVLIACESSGTVRRAFHALGHDVLSCDLLPADDDSPYHYQGDVRDLLDIEWDLIVAHPPCTYLCSSGLHWNHRVPGRQKLSDEALDFVRLFLEHPCPKVCVENPVGRIGTVIRPADQYVQPWQFGHDASKRTGFWLKGLPLLVSDPANHVSPRMVDGKPRWANQTDSGQNAMTPAPDRWKLRSETYEGIARAMAEQWGNLQ